MQSVPGRFVCTLAVAALAMGVPANVAHADLARTEYNDLGGAPDARALVPAAGREVLTLILCDVEGVLLEGREALAEETASVLRAIDVETTWRFSSPALGGCVADSSRLEIPVVALAHSDRTATGGRRPLGSTPTRGGLQPMWIYVAEVRSVLGWSASRPLDGTDWQRLARAIGRVVSHEIVHCLVPSHGHDKRGLMRASFRKVDLLTPELQIAPDWVGAVGRGWSQIVAAASRGTDTVAN
jgi:hypothetical protein